MKVPNWFGIGIAILVLIVIGAFGYKWFTTGAQRDASTYPKKAYQPPAYAQPGVAENRPSGQAGSPGAPGQP